MTLFEIITVGARLFGLRVIIGPTVSPIHTMMMTPNVGFMDAKGSFILGGGGISKSIAYIL